MVACREVARNLHIFLDFAQQIPQANVVLKLEDIDKTEEQNGIAGFAAPDILDGDESTIVLTHRPKDSSVQFHVKRSDIKDVVTGEVEEGSRLFQILLRPGAVVETKIEMLRSLKTLQDPTLKHLTATAISEVSAVAASR